jgi:exodeoxyribonuclease VII small subunit
MPRKKIHNDSISFEKALAELEETVRRLESPDLSLEEALEYFRAGVSLAGVCHNKLTAAQQEVKKIVEDSQRQISLLPWEFTEDEP